jgi:hypothetical protein
MVRCLGEGGMGLVYEVEDRERGEHVALKTLKRPTPELLYRLKREFRALADLQHPNLVALHELFAQEDGCYFTMELVAGQDFLRHVGLGDRPLALADTEMSLVGPPAAAPAGRRDALPGGSPMACDEARLRAVLPQLVRGLAALHASGKVHRDVKPSNLLVTPAGRLVVLDFGLVTHADHDQVTSLAGDIVGTVAYMSPEQARGDPASPASDWYAVGVVLFEALTGQVPFNGPAMQILVEKQQHPAPRARALVPTVPEDLDALCASLLARNPEDRPDGGAVLRRLGVVADAEALPGAARATSSSVPFAGRGAELATLQRVFAAKRRLDAAVAVVLGESGIGKSTLVRHFLEGTRASHPERVILEGRCYEREDVVYQAMDSLIDNLSAYWRGLSASEAAQLVPRWAALLPRLFPVLGRVPAVAGAPAVRPIADPQEVRTRAFAALREALARLAERRPLILYLDDLQWADAATLTLLADLMRPPDPPGLFLILASRSEGAAAVRALVEQMAAHASVLELAPLPEPAALELARGLLGAGAGHRAARVVSEAGGNPYFICELAQYALHLDEEATGQLRLDEALRRRIEGLPGPSRRLLELNVLAGEPLPLELLGAAAGLEHGAAARESGVLRTLRLAKVQGPRHALLIEPYHDRVRDATLALLPAAARPRLYRSLAAAAEGQAGPERLAWYWRGAGEDARAAGHARRAAAQALERLDFDGAAGLYRMTLALGAHAPAERRDLLTALGDLRELSRLVPAYIREAERRGDLYQQVNLRARLGMVWLAADQPGLAGEHVERAIAGWMPGRAAFQVQHFFALHGRAEAALYRGDPAAAVGELDAQARALARSLLLRVQMVSCEMLHLRARAQLASAAAASAASGRRDGARAARALAGRLRRLRLPLARAWAPLIEAGAARVEGDDERAVRGLRAAVAALGELEVQCYAHAARARLGALLGGDEGAALRAAASTYFAAEGVASPARLEALLVPGWPHPDRQP